jgi:multidrug efflux pump subunit AcrB
MNIVEFSIEKRVLVNMLMIAIFVAGVFSIFKLRREIFPSISVDIISVITLDVTLDAPEDIEKLITVPIEDELRDIEDVKEIFSVSAPNQSMIYLELHDNVDIQAVLNEVRQEVDQAKADLPRSAEPPITSELKFPFPVIIVGLQYHDNADRLAIKKLADDLQDQFESLPGVASIQVAGLSDREIWIEVDPYRTEAYGISLQEIGNAISAKNRDIPGGTLDSKSGELTVRLLEQVDEKSWQELDDVVIRRSGAQVVRLRDVATVHNTFEEDQTLGRVNARPAITFTVNKQKTGDTIAISDKVRDIVAQNQDRLPKGVTLTSFSDTSKYVRIRLRTMVRNGIISMTLVASILLLFMNWRISILVVGGLLVSFFGTFIYLVSINNSFNMLTLFSLIMVMGMLVDDAIVVCENVYRYMENGVSPYKAAVVGTQEVLWPVIGTVTTTVVAFLPLMLTTGLMGKFVNIIPQVITVALGLSLVEAMIILPSHLADFVRPSDMARHTLDIHSHHSLGERISTSLGNGLRFVQRTVERLLLRVLEYYRYMLKHVLRCRYFVLMISLLLFLSTFVMFKTGVIPFILFHADYADRFIVSLEAPPYYSLEETSRAVYALEKDIISNMPAHEIAAIITSIGSRMEDEFSSKQGHNQATIIFDIEEDHPDCRRPTPILKQLRSIVARHTGFVIARAEKEDAGPPVGKAVTVRIAGDNFGILQQIAEEYRMHLSTIPGIKDISDDHERGKKELHIEVDEERAALSGCDVATIGSAILHAFQGSEVSIFRWGNDEVTVRVKYAEDYTRSVDDLMNLRIVNAAGTLVPLGSIASISQAPGFTRINRRNRKRTISVFADVDENRITSKEANDKLRKKFKNINERYPGYAIEYGGEEKETEESMRSMYIAFILAFILIYAILATILNSFVQPFIILSIIPLGLVGVTYGFMIFQLPVGFMAIMGTIGLIGIIVNDSIVMVSFVNNYRYSWQRRHGMGIHSRASANRHLTRWVRWVSLMKSGYVRFRPILLTTVTTVVGMSTIAFTRSGQEQFIAPMALAIVCGLSIGSAVTLFITPSVYAVLDDIIHFFFGEGELPPDIQAETPPE